MKPYRWKLETFRFAAVMTVPVFIFWLYSRFVPHYQAMVNRMYANVPTPAEGSNTQLNAFLHKLDEERRQRLLQERDELMKSKKESH